ncbi:MAG: molybdopterin-dependent oxidoreductase, partial [Candidatus Bathyarchaeota archaeon]|nr:molybdopterin-dependent oxidoreductase [Candidatus Bathyarchaeota archaeon]
MTYVIAFPRTMRRKEAVSAILLASLIVTAVFAGHRIWVYETSKPNTLDSVEIREYEGQRLSSTSDFIENSINGPQQISRDNYTLKVTGLVDTSLTLTYEEIVSSYEHYEKVLTLHCVEGWEVTILWEGFLVRDLIEDAATHSEAKVVIFYAYDGYSTSLPLEYIANNDILMAHKMNGIELPPERGFPFQLVAESKLGYKWIKW